MQLLQTKNPTVRLQKLFIGVITGLYVVHVIAQVCMMLRVPEGMSGTSGIMAAFALTPVWFFAVAYVWSSQKKTELLGVIFRCVLATIVAMMTCEALALLPSVMSQNLNLDYIAWQASVVAIVTVLLSGSLLYLRKVKHW